MGYVSRSSLKFDMDVGGAYGKSEPAAQVNKHALYSLLAYTRTIENVIFRNSL